MFKRFSAALAAVWLCLAAPAAADPATNYSLLPLIQAQATTSQTGDGLAQIAFQSGSPAAPIDLTSITFALQWHPAPGGAPNTVIVSLSAGQYLTNGGATGVLTLKIPQAKLRILPVGTYVASLVATLGGNVTDLGVITITHTALGPSSITSLTTTQRNSATATTVGYVPGPQGLSAYQAALANGFSGSQAQWLASLVGSAGATGPPGSQGATGPAGAQGPTGGIGPANSLAVGTVATGAAGSSASATITGTAPSQTLSLTIPQGNVGATGSQGPTGATGATGATGPQAWQTPPAAWAASTTYTATAPASTVTYGGESYVCFTSHTSTSSFDSSKWTKLAAKGADGSPAAGAVLYTAQSLTSGQQDQVRVNIGGAIASAPSSSTTLASTDIDRPLYPTGSPTITMPNGGAGWRSGPILNSNTTSGIATLAVPSAATLDGVTNGTTTLAPKQKARVVQTGSAAYITDWIDQSPIVAKSTVGSSVSSIILNVPTGYSGFRVVMSGLKIDTAGANLNMQFSSDGGSTFKSGSTDYNFQLIYASASSVAAVSPTASALELAYNLSAGTHPLQIEGVLHPGGAALQPIFQHRVAFYDNSGVWNQRYYAGRYATAVLAANAIRIFPSSGNISAGTILLYGVPQ